MRMKDCQIKIYFILTIVLLGTSPILHATTSFDGLFLTDIQKNSIQDTLSIDQLLTQLSNANQTQKGPILKRLEKFNSKQFSSAHKDKIRTLLIASPSRNLILLAGFLELKPTLFTLAKKHKGKKNLLQPINIALVRAGHFPKANTLLKNLEKLTINDPFVYEVLPLLTYTKERIIYDWLLDQILLEEKNCHPADAEGSGNINCAYRIMEAVAPTIIDFPVQLDKWGDLNVDSYSKALTTVRDWIRTHKKDYTLDKHTY